MNSSSWQCPALLLLASHSLAFGQVAAPVFVPGASQDSVPFSVAVTCTTPGSTIHYTTNGSTPALTDPLVPGDNLVVIPRSVTLKAKAWSSSATSAVTTATYKVVGHIAAGGFHGIAVKTNKTGWSWGLQTSGALGNGVGTATNQLAPGHVKKSSSLDFLDAVEAAAGRKHGVLLQDSGAVQAFGLNSSGQLGNNTAVTPSNNYPVGVLKSTTAGDLLTGCIQVSAADSYSAALGSNGYVYTWGADNNGRLGRIVSGSDNQYARVVKLATGSGSLTGIRQIAAGKYHMLARTAHDSETAGGTGRVWAWGLNSSGQLGLGNTTDYDRAFETTAAFLADVTDLSAGEEHSAVVRWKSTIQGKVYCFGQSEFGRLGNNSTAAGLVKNPVEVQKSGGTSLDHIVAVAAGPRHTLALDDTGHVWAWGTNANGELGDGSLTSVNRGYASKVRNSTDTADLTDIVNISAGGVDYAGFNFATAADGTVYSWGANTYGQLGIGSTVTRKLPSQIADFKLTNQGAPTVSLTAVLPATAEPVTVTLNAEASDPDGLEDIASVAFYNGTTLLKNDTTVPFSVGWNNVAGGPWSVSAVATDLAGTQTTASMTVTVPSLVSVQTIDAVASEDGMAHGKFRISRLTSNSSSLLVKFTLGGVAINGWDYLALPLSATIPANAASVDVVVAGKVDYLKEDAESVIITIVDPNPPEPILYYSNPSLKSATVSLTDATVYDGDGLTLAQEQALGTSPVLDDTDGDGVNDNLDAFPLDTTRWAAASAVPGDSTKPLVTLLAPASATYVSGP